MQVCVEPPELMPGVRVHVEPPGAGAKQRGCGSRLPAGALDGLAVCALWIGRPCQLEVKVKPTPAGVSQPVCHSCFTSSRCQMQPLDWNQGQQVFVVGKRLQGTGPKK